MFRQITEAAMSEQPDSFQKLAQNPFFWPCAIALALAVLLTLIPGVPASVEILVDAVLLLLLGAFASTNQG